MIDGPVAYSDSVLNGSNIDECVGKPILSASSQRATRPDQPESSTTSFGNHSESYEPVPSFPPKTRIVLHSARRTAQRSDLREQSAFRRRGSLAEQRTTPRSSHP